MRTMISLAIAAAFAGAGPALAQDANNTAAAAPATVVDANAADANAVAVTPANDVAASPEAVPPVMADTSTDVPQEKDSGGFPWGVLGVLGLLGLFPRKTRS